MKITIQNKRDFIKNFLSPIGKVCENAVVNIKKDSISSLTCTNDSTLFLNCRLNQNNNVDENVMLNIPDINKLVNALMCTSKDSLEFELDNNCIRYSSNDIKFKLHLLEDGIITTPTVDVNKIKQINFTTSFDLTYNTLQTLVRGSTFATDVNKLYFSNDGTNVRAEITDSEVQNINSFSSVISDSYTGQPISEPRPLTFETVRFIMTTQFEKCTVHHSDELNVFLFDISTPEYNINYIASGLRR